ncbi:MAG TPA: hypothetical protein VMV10_02545 [Pirellulales bacterium]|nr:hypothetical protein [Pirellulales bacterium]
MTTVAGQTRPRRHAPRIPVTVQQESAYERVASMLLALLILIGVVVFCLLMAWLGSRVFFPPLKSVPVRLEQVGGGIESGVVGESMQLDSPTPQDVAQESDLVEPDFQDTLKTVLDAVALREADLDTPAETEQDTTNKGGGQQTGTGNVAGYGSGPGKPGIPPHLRWQIHFDAGGTLDGYAKQLDFFKIELGVLDSKQVIYASNLSFPKATVRTGPGGPSEQRLYFSWRHGKLREADHDLIQRAGVQAAGKMVLQFYPDPVEQMLLHLEQDYRGLDASKIRKTVFGIRKQGKGYEFFVIDQTPL